MFHKTDKVFFGIVLASIMILGGFSFSSNLLPEADAAAYIKFDGIDGEARDSAHSGWSEALAFSFGVEREMSGATGGKATSTSSFSDFSIVKQIDKSSPGLFLASANGQVIPTFSFEITHDDGAKLAYLKYELTNVMVTSYNISGGDTGTPVETISLNFEKITFSYIGMDSKTGTQAAPISSNWDIAKNDGG